MRFITISAAVLLGSALSAAHAQELRAANATPSTKNNVQQKGYSGPGMQFVSGGSDTCGTATAISGLGLFPGDNTGAGTDGPAAPCVTMGADVWYDWTATATASHTMSFCAANGGTANYDTALVVYDGNTCVGTVVACNDDTCGLQSQVTFAATNGNVYKIRIGGFGSVPATGTYTLSITSAGGPPANDDCNTPTVITGCGTAFPFNNTGATTGTQGQGNANCLFFGQMGITNDLWFSWVSPATGSITLALCAQTTMDSKVAIYDGTGCPAAGAIACNDDSCGLQSSVTFAAILGNPYTFQLGNFPGAAGGSGTFTVSCPPPPAGPCDSFDDGTTESSVGTNNPAHDILWLHSQGAVGISTAVKSIRTAWGSPLFGGGNAPPNGSPARVGIWSDPNNDGNPTDAVLIQEVSTTISGSNTDAFQTVMLSPTVFVTDKYFIGASCVGGTFPAPLDQSSGPGAGRVWIVASTVGPINYASIGTEEIPPTDEDSVAPGVWLLRGDCKDISIEEMCFGDSPAACPCLNFTPLSTNGCGNSAAAGGAHLSGTGNPIVSADTVSVTGSDLREGRPTLALFFSGGEVPANPVNDGSLCAGSPICRLWIWKVPLTLPQDVVTVTGPDASTIPPNVGIAQRSADLGRPIMNSETRIYTIWYRDNTSFACADPARSNYTNGLRILWSQ